MLSKLRIMVTVGLLIVGGSTSQSLGQVCSATPQTSPDASLAADGMLLIKETRPGRELLKITFKHLLGLRDVNPFGDPVTGTTSYAICIYDDADTLVAQMEVDQAQQDCGTPPKPCWRTIPRGVKYGDKDSTADGMKRIIMKGDGPSPDRRRNLLPSSKIIVRGENNAAKGQTSLPTGIAAALQGNRKAMVNVVTSDGDIFILDLLSVKTADGLVFRCVF